MSCSLFVAIESERSAAVALVQLAPSELGIAAFTTIRALQEFFPGGTAYGALDVEAIVTACEHGGYGVVVDPGSSVELPIRAGEVSRLIALCEDGRFGWRPNLG